MAGTGLRSIEGMGLRSLEGRLPTAWKRPLRRGADRLQARAVDPVVRLVQRRLHRMPYVHGPTDRVILGERVSLMNCVLNTVSGTITIGDDTILGHNCMLLTGRHECEGGARKRLQGRREVPREGHDIRIGRGCWIASGVIVVGGVTIGEHVVVASGAVVAADLPDGAVVGGVPARPLAS